MANPGFDLMRVMLAVLFIAGLLVASVWILYPFLPALIWATLLVVATWPLLLMVQKRLGGRRSLAVTVMTGLLLLVVIVPIALAVTTLMDNADRLVVRAQALKEWSVPDPPAWVERIPIVGSRVAGKWRELAELDPEQLHARLDPYSRDITRWVLQQAGSLAVFFLHLLLTLILAAVLYFQGDVAARGLRAFATRLAGPRGEHMTILAGQAIRAVALGVVVTAAVQSVLGGIGLAVAGVPYAAVLTALMFVLGVAQIGAGPVLIVSVIWLYTKSDPVTASIFLVWAIFVGSIDNFLRPMLIKMGADLPLLLIFAGVIGGLLAFGVVGLFVGPVVLAVVYTLLTGWVSDAEAARSEAHP